MINRVVVAGRLAEDPIVRRTAGGEPLVVLSLDVQQPRWGTTEPEVACIEAHAFGRRAETIAKYCERGRALLVEGYLRREGEDLVVIVEQSTFLERGLRSRSLWAEASVAQAAA